MEVASTHNILHTHIDELAKDPNDRLRVIMKELDAFGPPPEVAREDNREVQLTLSSRFEERVTFLSLFCYYILFICLFYFILKLCHDRLHKFALLPIKYW